MLRALCLAIGLLTAGPIAPAKAQPRPHLSLVQRLHRDVKVIIIGPRNSFLFEDHVYEEGDTILKSNWVVTSITESGIRLRGEDGSQSDFIAFRRLLAAPAGDRKE